MLRVLNCPLSCFKVGGRGLNELVFLQQLEQSARFVPGLFRSSLDAAFVNGYVICLVYFIGEICNKVNSLFTGNKSNDIIFFLNDVEEKFLCFCSECFRNQFCLTQ